MLIQPNREFLGDKHLKDAEAVARMKENNAKLTEAFKIPNQDLLEDKKAALGLPLAPSELILRLQRLNNKILIQQGGIRNAVAVRYPVEEDGKIVQKYITGFYVDNVLPEYSTVVVDDRGKPWREIRGWRTVLTALIRQGIITEKQADLTFGRPKTYRAKLWEKQRQAERNNGHERKN